MELRLNIQNQIFFYRIKDYLLHLGHQEEGFYKQKHFQIYLLLKLYDNQVITYYLPILVIYHQLFHKMFVIYFYICIYEQIQLNELQKFYLLLLICALWVIINLSIQLFSIIIFYPFHIILVYFLHQIKVFLSML